MKHLLKIVLFFLWLTTMSAIAYVMPRDNAIGIVWSIALVVGVGAFAAYLLKD